MLTILMMAAQVALPRGGTPKGGTPRWVRKWSPLLWLLPAMTLYIIFKLAPMISGIYLSLLRWDGIEPPEFVGLQNYIRMLDDEIIAIALWNNVLYALGT